MADPSNSGEQDKIADDSGFLSVSPTNVSVVEKDKKFDTNITVEPLCYSDSNFTMDLNSLSDTGQNQKDKSSINLNGQCEAGPSGINNDIQGLAEEVIVKTSCDSTENNSTLCSAGTQTSNVKTEEDEDSNCEENDSDQEEDFDVCESYLSSGDKIDYVPKKPHFNGDCIHKTKSTLKRKAEDEGDNKEPKRKRTIQFDKVTVFYFPRSQGFTCVPSQGGSTLGMSRKHFSIKSYSLTEHAAEQRKAHRDYLLKLRQRKSNQEKRDMGSQCSSSEESEENSEEASDISDSELEADSFFFLQPLPIRQRRALLRQSGIRQIEGLEKDECKDIRLSREMCGCQCKVICDPNTCQCYEAGIKCQVDRHSFPCGCTREGCGNANGRIEFNPIRVRTHFLHTLMRLEIEKRQANNQWGDFRKKDGTIACSRLAPSWIPSSSINQSHSSSIQLFDSSLSLASCSEVPPSCSNVIGPPPLYSPFDHSQLNNGLSNVPVFQRMADNGANYGPNGCSVFSEGVMSPFDSPLIPPYGTPTAPPPFSPQSNFFRPKLPPSSFGLSSFSSYSGSCAYSLSSDEVERPPPLGLPPPPGGLYEGPPKTPFSDLFSDLDAEPDRLRLLGGDAKQSAPLFTSLYSSFPSETELCSNPLSLSDPEKTSSGVKHSLSDPQKNSGAKNSELLHLSLGLDDDTPTPTPLKHDSSSTSDFITPPKEDKELQGELLSVNKESSKLPSANKESSTLNSVNKESSVPSAIKESPPLPSANIESSLLLTNKEPPSLSSTNKESSSLPKHRVEASIVADRPAPLSNGMGSQVLSRSETPNLFDEKNLLESVSA